jgi:hypothetical protein
MRVPLGRRTAPVPVNSAINTPSIVSPFSYRARPCLFEFFSRQKLKNTISRISLLINNTSRCRQNFQNKQKEKGHQMSSDHRRSSSPPRSDRHHRDDRRPYAPPRSHPEHTSSFNSPNWSSTDLIYWKNLFRRVDIARKEGWARYYRAQEREDELRTLIKYIPQESIPPDVLARIAKNVGAFDALKRTCSSCHEVMKFEESASSVCNHMYHRECLEKLRAQHGGCKQCRAEYP